MGMKPEKRIMLYWFVQASIISGILSSIVAGALTVLIQERALEIFLILLTLGNILAAIHTFYRYRSWDYEVKNDHLYLEHGVLVKVKTIVPFVRIQHVDTQKSIIDRLLGVSSVVVYTAGSRGSDVSIPGVIPKQADELQDNLKNKAVESEDRDGV